jgi:hypothetical protein
MYSPDHSSQHKYEILSPILVSLYPTKKYQFKNEELIPRDTNDYRNRIQA